MAPPDEPPDADPKVKDLIDAATRADLERWFGLPSFQQLAEEGKQAAQPAEDDPELVASRAQREKALAAVDPQLVDRHYERYDVDPETVIKFRAQIDVRVDPSVAQVDHAAIERRHLIAEPRELELPWQLKDDLNECAPQALLRDLHRPELDFEKTFELIDVLAEARVDGVAEVAEVMRTRWNLRSFDTFAAADGRAMFDETRRAYREPIAAVLPLLTNRQVQD